MTSEMASYVANVGMSMLFGLGYYLVKKKKTPKTEPSTKEVERDLLSLSSVTSLADIHSLIKEKKLESDQYEIINLLIQKGFTPTTETYNLLLSDATSSKLFSTAQKIKAELLQNLDSNIKNKEDNLKGDKKNLNKDRPFSDILPDSVSLSLMIKGLGIEYASVLHNSNNKLNNEEENLETCEGVNYSSELSPEKKQKFDLELRGLVTKFASSGIELDINCHNNLINSLIETNRLEDAWRHFRYLKDNHEKELSKESKDWDNDCNYQEQKNKFLPNAFTYINLIKGIKRLSNLALKKVFAKKASNFFSECDYLKSSPGYSSIFLSLIDLLVKQSLYTPTVEEDMKLVETLLYENENKFLKIIELESAYTSVINGYAKMKDLNGAMRLFENLKKAFNCRVEELKQQSKQKNKSVALDKIFQSEFGSEALKNEEAEEKNTLNLSAYCYASILNACSRTKNLDVAEILLDEMKAMGIQPNQYVYATIINGYKKIGNFQAALRLYAKIRENSLDAEASEDIKLSVVIFNSILDCCVGCGEFDQMQLIFNYLADLGNSNNFIGEKCSVSSVLSQKTRIKSQISADLISYSILIKGYAKANNLNKVLEVYSYLKENFEVDEVLFNTILDCFVVNNNQSAFERILREMKEAEIKPSVITYGIIMKLYANKKDLGKATELFYEMIEKGISPSIIIYQLLIKLNSKLGKYEECMNLYKKLCESSLKPDCMLTDYMVDMYCRNFLVEEATEVCELALNGFTEELKNQLAIHQKNQSFKEKLERGQLSNSEFLLGLINTYECEKEEHTNKDQKVLNFNFDNNSSTSMLDLGTVEFFLWGVIEEQDLIYIDKKMIIERLARKISSLYILIQPYTITNSITSQYNDQLNTKNICTNYNTNNTFDDSKSLSTIVTNTMNNKGNLSYKLVNMILKLKKDVELFLNNSSYDKSKKFNKSKVQHYENNSNYQERILANTKQYQNRQRMANNNEGYGFNNYQKYNYRQNKYDQNCYQPSSSQFEQEEEFFNAEKDFIDFNDNASQTTFRSQFRLKPSANYFQKRQNEDPDFKKSLERNNVEMLFENEESPAESAPQGNNNNNKDAPLKLDLANIKEDLKSEIDFDDDKSIFEDEIIEQTQKKDYENKNNNYNSYQRKNKYDKYNQSQQKNHFENSQSYRKTNNGYTEKNFQEKNQTERKHKNLNNLYNNYNGLDNNKEHFQQENQQYNYSHRNNQYNNGYNNNNSYNNYNTFRGNTNKLNLFSNEKDNNQRKYNNQSSNKTPFESQKNMYSQNSKSIYG